MGKDGGENQDPEEQISQAGSITSLFGNRSEPAKNAYRKPSSNAQKEHFQGIELVATSEGNG